MRDMKGKTAIVTGAASGIGLGLARAFARAGMNVALADIEAGPLDAARRDVEALGARAIAVVTDVSDPASMRAAAQAAQSAFGALHIACNNAGVSVHGTPLEATRREDIDWIVAVNIGGVINGIQAFLPAIRAHGQGGHIVNTASIGGLQVNKDFLTGYYSMTKYAVVALSEALENELAGTNIGVSVLCPAAVNTKIWGTARARPARLGGPFERPENHFMRATLERVGMAPDLIGERVVGAIRDGEFYILTHANLRDRIEARHARIAAALDRAATWEREIAARSKT